MHIENSAPLYAIHPGAALKEALKSKGLKQKDFADSIGIQPSHLSEIIKGKREFTKALAEKLEQALGIPYQYWVNLMAQYDINQKQTESRTQEEQQAEEELREFNKVYDLKEIISRLKLTNQSSAQTRRFLIDQLNISFPINAQNAHVGLFHKSAKTGLDTRRILAWTLLAKYEARKCSVSGVFSRNDIPTIEKGLCQIFNENRDTIKRLTELLSNHGIRFTVVGKLDKASIDGYSFIDDGIPAIVVTCRYPRIDNLAFAVLHEFGHIVKHLTETDSQRVSMALSEDSIESKEEREANEYAANILIPAELWKTAPTVKMYPPLIQRAYSNWAEINGLNKWIVLGRISHETGMYRFRSDSSRDIL